jgi:iron(III) transport system permease protein
MKSLRVKYFGKWRITAFLISLCVIIPLAVVLLSFLYPAQEIWDHLMQNVLKDLLVNTFWLVLGVSTLTVLLGVSLAWMTAVCDFPGRKFFSWALMLPLAVPTYVLAFVFLGLLDYSGPVQTQLRIWFGPENVLFPDIRSTGGVIAVLSLALYPYVYLISRNAFLTQGIRTLEVAQSLGYNQTEGFFRIALPMARPWIAGGLMLVMMEALADFGAVSIFNFDTFTTAIYKAWFGFFSLSAAAQLSSILVILVFVIIIIEQQMRAKMRYYQPGRHSVKSHRFRLKGGAGWAACITAFIIPSVQLLYWSYDVIREEFNARYFGFLTHSLSLGIMASLLTCTCALILSYARRHHTDRVTDLFVRVSTLGYALPGTILAVGIFIPIAAMDNFINDFSIKFFSAETGPVLQGTLLVMVLAYLVRFMAAGYNSIDNSMQRITRSIDEAANVMGLNGLNMLRRIHLPILRAGMLTAATLVFIDVMKEMPITLMTRPFGWDTLAVKIYELTSEGEWERAALPAITLIIAGLLPIVFLIRQTEK